MIVCIDADHRADTTVTAIIGIPDWAAEKPCYAQTYRSSSPPAEYVPGEFYRRELPGTLAAVEAAPDVEVVVIDGYVWLASDRPGLGARLFDAIERPVVGVAKTKFHDNDRAVAVLRGASASPLYVTAAGIDVHEAAALVIRMHGPFRLPTVLKHVDRLARDG